MKPELGAYNDFTKQEQLLWQKVVDQYRRIDSGILEYSQLSAKDQDLIDSLEAGYGPMTAGPECSWYCGGEMYKVTSDTYLPEQGGVSYKPDNIHDFNLFTAWAPDTTHGVIGKKISFHFKFRSPRVNQVLIYNGYIKNADLFKANARVKKFRLYINDVYYATLELEDVTAQQSFMIDPVRSENKEKDLVLTFEIEEIYPGSKYRDVVVSEINFSGLDVH
ncbi:MAG: hypothetical protein ABW019_00590 [Chitinophagaceae bacterium]